MVGILLGALLLAAPGAARAADRWQDGVLRPLARFALDLAEGDGQGRAGLIDADAAANVVLRVSVEDDPSTFGYWVHNLATAPVRVGFPEARAAEDAERRALDAAFPDRFGPSAADFLARTSAVLRLAAAAAGRPDDPAAVAAGWEFFGFRRGGVEDMPSIGSRARAQSLKLLRLKAGGAAADAARTAAARRLWSEAERRAHATQFLLTGGQARAAALALHPDLDAWGSGREGVPSPSSASWAALRVLAEADLDWRGGKALRVALDADAATLLADGLDLLAARSFPPPARRAASVARPAAPLFEDATSTANFAVGSGDALDLVTIGAACLDYDGDGRPDLFVGGGRGRGGRLYRNEGRMRFAETSALPGLKVGERAATADYDGDGRTDLVVLGDPESETKLFHNDGGAFHDATAEAGLAVPKGLVEDAVWFDADGDGDLDLYLVYLGRTTDRVTPAADGANGSPNRLFLNDGGRFREATEGSGLEDAHWSWAAEALDYDGDGRQDVVLCNLWGPSRLFHSLGGGRFEDASARAGLSLPSLCRGVSVGDADGDGRPDLYLSAGTMPQEMLTPFGGRETALVSQSSFTQGYGGGPAGWQEDQLLLNRGDGTFRLASSATLEGRAGMDWNGLMADLDLDGRSDLFHVNGFYPDTLFFHDERKVLRLGAGDGSFRAAPAGNGADLFGCSRASLTADFDGDGCPDLLVTGLHGARLLRGRCPAGARSLALSLRQPGPNRDALGATVAVTAGGRTQTLFWGGPGGGQVSSWCGPRTVGLAGAARADSAVVSWPDGTRESFGPLPAGRPATLEKGRGRAVDGARR